VCPPLLSSLHLHENEFSLVHRRPRYRRSDFIDEPAIGKTRQDSHLCDRGSMSERGTRKYLREEERGGESRYRRSAEASIGPRRAPSDPVRLSIHFIRNAFAITLRYPGHEPSNGP